MELRFYRNPQFFCIISNPLKAYVHFSSYCCIIWRKVKRDYIGVKIVIEVFFINLQNGSVATEYIVYGAKPSLLLPKD